MLGSGLVSPELYLANPYAFEMAQKAVSLDDSLPLAHVVLGQVYLGQEQYEQAVAEGKRAVTLAPNFAPAYSVLGLILTAVGRSEEAIAVVQQALRLNPHYPVTDLNALGQAYLGARRHEEALAVFKRALTRNPDLWATHWGLAIIYSELGREEEARAAAAEMLRISPNFSVEGWRQKGMIGWPFSRVPSPTHTSAPCSVSRACKSSSRPGKAAGRKS